MQKLLCRILMCVCVCLLGLAISMCVFVGAPPMATAAEAIGAAASSPQGRFVQNLGNRAISILADKTITETSRAESFHQILREAFDLPLIARFVIGRNSWQFATNQQRQEYMRLFEELLVRTYSERFSMYTGEGFRVSDVREEGERDVVVSSEITHPDGSQPLAVDWRVRQKDGKMGIIDVVVEGVSMSVTQRQEYTSVIQRNGGDIEGLLELMRNRVAQKPIVQ